MYYLLLIIVACVVLFFVIDKAIKKLDEKAKEQTNAQNKAFSDAVATYGTPEYDNDVISGDGHITDFPQVGKVLLGTILFDYSDILVVGEKTKLIAPAENTKTVTHTKHNLGSAAGRAVAGALIAGPVGAVVGGVTGKTTSETQTVAGHDDLYRYTLTVTATGHYLQFGFLDFHKFSRAKNIVSSVLERKKHG